MVEIGFMNSKLVKSTQQISITEFLEPTEHNQEGRDNGAERNLGKWDKAEITPNIKKYNKYKWP